MTAFDQRCFLFPLFGESQLVLLRTESGPGNTRYRLETEGSGVSGRTSDNMPLTKSSLLSLMQELTIPLSP